MTIIAALLPTACASGGARQAAVIDRMLHMCRLLSPGGPEGNLAQRDDEVWFWLHRERVDASRLLWSRSGVRTLEDRIARTPAGHERLCLEHALREARSHNVEYF